MKTLYTAIVVLIAITIIVILVIVFSKNAQASQPPDNIPPYPSSIMTDSARKSWVDVFKQPQFSGLGDIGAFNCRVVEGTSEYSDHSWGNAIDFTGSSNLLQTLRDYLEKNAGKLNVKYVIYNRQISTAGKNRRAYTGSDPHILHLHVDFYPSPTGNPPCAGNLRNLPYGD